MKNLTNFAASLMLIAAGLALSAPAQAAYPVVLVNGYQGPVARSPKRNRLRPTISAISNPCSANREFRLSSSTIARPVPAVPWKTSARASRSSWAILNIQMAPL